MRQQRVFPEHPDPVAGPAGEGMRCRMPCPLEFARRAGRPQLHARPLYQIGEAPPIRLEASGGDFEQECRSCGAPRLDARRIRVHPHRRVLHEAEAEWAEVRKRGGFCDRLVIASLVIGVEQALEIMRCPVFARRV